MFCGGCLNLLCLISTEAFKSVHHNKALRWVTSLLRTCTNHDSQSVLSITIRLHCITRGYFGPIASYQSHIPIQLPLTPILCVWLNWDENGYKLRHWPTMAYNACMAIRFIGCPWASFCSSLNMLALWAPS